MPSHSHSESKAKVIHRRSPVIDPSAHQLLVELDPSFVLNTSSTHSVYNNATAIAAAANTPLFIVAFGIAGPDEALDDATLALDAVAAVTWLPEVAGLPVVLVPAETVGAPVEPVTEAAAEAGGEDGLPLPRMFKPAVTVTGVNPNMSPV